jgi:hypothetical protein
MKKCYACGIMKDLDQFYKRTASKDGRQHYCKECGKKKDNRYHIENRDVINAKARQRYSDRVGGTRVKLTPEQKKERKRNRERRYYHNVVKANPTRYKKLLEYQKQYNRVYCRDQSKRREYFRKYKCKRRKDNIQCRLAENLRNRLNGVLKGRCKNGSAVRDLGCTLEELRQYLASHFESWMTWDNYGTKWEIDHIKPLCMFDLEDRVQFLEACHYTNLRPLSCEKNRQRKYEEFDT